MKKLLDKALDESQNKQATGYFYLLEICMLSGNHFILQTVPDHQ